MSRRQEIFKLVEGLIKDHKGSEYEVSLDLDLRKDLEVDSVDLPNPLFSFAWFD